MNIEIYRVQYEICGQRFYIVDIRCPYYRGFSVFNTLFSREMFIERRIKYLSFYYLTPKIEEYGYLKPESYRNLLDGYFDPFGLFTKLSDKQVYKRYI